MSPITKPSALEFQEASCDPEFSSIFAARHVPRVSTQKRPHLTGLSPALPQMMRPSHKRESFDSQLPRAGEQSPLWTESVFPVGREDPEQIGNLSMASSFITNSLGPKKRSSRREEESERKRIEWPRKPPVIDWPGRPPVRGKFVRREQHKMSGLGVLDRKTKRKPLIAEKSFDHEVNTYGQGKASFNFSHFQTPFNFGHHPPEMELESPGKELPKTKAALLDFHASENPVKQNKV